MLMMLSRSDARVLAHLHQVQDNGGRMVLTKRWIMVGLVIVGILAADQISKLVVTNELEFYESVQPIPALSDYFQFTRTSNTGSAFGFLPQAGDLFLIIAVVVVLALLYFYPRIPDEGHVTRLATGLVVGGALGNALDRLHYGHVVDFIHYRIPDVISNVSNLADHAIVFGVILIFIDSFRLERLQKMQQAVDEPEAELPYNDS